MTTLIPYRYDMDVPADVLLLAREIESGVGVSNYIVTSPAGVEINFEEPLTKEAHLALGQIVAGHNLSAAKKVKKDAIDARTNVLIEEGFLFNGTAFPLTQEHRLYWTAMYASRNEPSIAFPIKVWSKDGDSSIDIQNVAELEGFCLSALAAAKGHLDSGMALKQAVNEAADVAAVEAVTDDR